MSIIIRRGVQPKRSPVVWLIVAAGLVVVVGVAAYFFLPLLSARSELATLTEEAHKQGIPVNLEDLPPPKPVPDDRNAAIIYDRLDAEADGFRIVVGFDNPTKFSTAASHLRRGMADPDDIKVIESEIAKLKGPLAEADRASRMPYCDFHWNLADPNTRMDALGTIRRLIELLATKARVEATKGDVGQAVDTIAAGFRITQQRFASPC